MADLRRLRDDISQKWGVKSNGSQAITGDKLKGAMLDVIDTLNDVKSDQDYVNEWKDHVNDDMEHKADQDYVDAELAKKADASKLSELEPKIASLDNLESWQRITGFMNVSGIFENPAFAYIVIPVKAGDNISIAAGSNATYTYYYVTTDIPKKSSAVPWATGFGTRQSINAGSTVNIEIPSDGAYIILQVVQNNVEDYPSAFYINGYNIAIGVKENIGNIAGGIDSLREEVQPALKLGTSNIYNNILYGYGLHFRGSGGTGLVKSVDADGHLRFTIAQGAGAAAGSWCWFSLNTKTPNVFKHGHQYLVALDVLVTSNSLTEGTTTASGNNMFDMYPKYDSPPLGDYQPKQTAVTGTRGAMIALMRVTNSEQDGTFLFVQFGKYTSADYLDVTIYGACALDLESSGVNPWDTVGFNAALEKFSMYGFADKIFAADDAVHSLMSDKARVAESVESLNIGGDIDIWGDSLTAQGWGNDLAQITGRNVFSHGYGGRTSTYIRDQFLAGLNRDRTNIFWVGRNNVSRYDAVIDDIRTMVDALGTQKFIVMSVLNGAYDGEYKDQSSYAKFVKIAEKLKQIYPDNFVDIRSAIIQGWECGNVRLLAPFTQPSVGQNVTINVSDATFLATLNEYDVTYIGEDVMNKIKIGINDQYDTYSIVSLVDATHLTVKLETIGRVQTGQSVGNAIDPNNNPSVGASTAIEYVRVMQNGDYVCINQYDTTPSTSRADRIHQSPAGRNFTARVIARALEARKL